MICANVLRTVHPNRIVAVVARHPRKNGEPIEPRGPEYFEPFVKPLRRKLLAPPDSVLVVRSGHYVWCGRYGPEAVEVTHGLMTFPGPTGADSYEALSRPGK
jgi:hypothetical protein